MPRYAVISVPGHFVLNIRIGDKKSSLPAFNVRDNLEFLQLL